MIVEDAYCCSQYKHAGIGGVVDNYAIIQYIIAIEMPTSEMKAATQDSKEQAAAKGVQ